MKRIITLSLAAAMLLATLTGCAALRTQEPDVGEDGGAAALTVRIVNRSTEELFSVATSYGANGETLGSRACSQADGSKSALARTGAVEFGFRADELPAELTSFCVDVYAAEKAGEDFKACGGAAIRDPQPGETYTLAIGGDFASGLYLTAEDPDHTLAISAPGETIS